MFASVIVTGVNYSSIELQNRHVKIYDDYSKTGLLIHDNIEVIENMNFPKDSKFVIAPDLCQNGGLFFLNRMGWSIQNEKDIVIDKINQYKVLGADYLILVSDEHAFLSTDDIAGELALKGKGIEIYKLNNTPGQK